MRRGSRAAANLGENEDAGGVAHGLGKAKRGWRGGCCPGPRSGPSRGLHDGQDPRGRARLVVLGVLGRWHGSCLLGVWGQHLGASRSKHPVPPAPSAKAQLLFLPSQLREQPLASAAPAPQVGTARASSRGTRWRFWGRVSAWQWVQALPDPPSSNIYMQVPVLRLPFPSFSRCQLLRDAAALCGRLRFIHYFISTRL